MMTVAVSTNSRDRRFECRYRPAAKMIHPKAAAWTPPTSRHWIDADPIESRQQQGETRAAILSSARSRNPASPRPQGNS